VVVVLLVIVVVVLMLLVVLGLLVVFCKVMIGLAVGGGIEDEATGFSNRVVFCSAISIGICVPVGDSRGDTNLSSSEELAVNSTEDFGLRSLSNRVAPWE